MHEEEEPQGDGVQLFALEEIQLRLSNLQYGLVEIARRDGIDPQSRCDLLRVSQGLQSVIDAAQDKLDMRPASKPSSAGENAAGVRAALRKISENEGLKSWTVGELPETKVARDNRPSFYKG